MGCDLRVDGRFGVGRGGCLDWRCLNCDLGGFGGWAVICAWMGVWGGGGGGCLDWHCLNCDLGGFGGWAVISLAAMVGRVGWGVLSGLGGCRDCCIRPLPSVQRMKSATGKFWDFGRWAVICVAASVGRVGRGCCLDWGVVGTVVRPLPSVQRMKSATGELWELGGWAGWQRRGWL